jgi:transcriptional regulator with XRE-family HTH domain
VSEDPFFAVLRMRIHMARLAKGIRQEDIAELAQLQLRSYARFEAIKPDKGRFNPTVRTLRMIAKTLDLELPELMHEPRETELALLEERIPARVKKPI